MSPRFSIIVPTCNRPAELAACLERLLPDVQSVSDVEYELIVTDDGRKLPARELVASRFPSARWTLGPARGPASNRNHGASLALGEWLIFIDDDCLPEPQLLLAYQQFATADEVATALQGPTVRIGSPDSLLWDAPHNPDGDGCISANFAIRKSAFLSVGRFDERFPNAATEDTEFFERFKLSGGIVKFVPQAIVYHPLRRIGNGKSLASKWEGKVIWALDQGTPPVSIVWRLPWHVLRVIQSRFRGKKLTRENVKALLTFSREWLGVLAASIPWTVRWTRRGRSDFWKSHVERVGPPRKFGF